MAQKRLLDDPLRWPEDPKAADEIQRANEPTKRRGRYFAGWSPPSKEKPNHETHEEEGNGRDRRPD